ncbi:unnamed protein product [Urochloa decumbens]|uniref:DUF7595 domain-containing protein n=1 Tax=Urochloa decumbens TaxID=240449 RepID=A0ABC9BZH2_9POAL
MSGKDATAAAARCRWRRFLADPVFLRRLLPEAGRSSSLLGFFVQRHRPSVSAWRTVANIFKSRVPAFVPAPGSALGPRRRSLTSFVRDSAGLLVNAEPLTARDGLILLRVSPSLAAAVGKLFSLCVCSLLTGKLDVLPPLDAACFDDEGVRGYAILRSVNQGDVPHRPAHGYSNLCQVLLIGVHRSNRQLHIHSFSTDAAALQSWGATPANYLPGDPVLFSGPYGRAATVCHDAAHWLFGEHGSTGPTIYTIDVAHLIIGTRQDVDQSGTAPWTCTQGILVDVKELWSLRRLRLAMVCVGEKSGIVLVLSGSGPNHTYLLDLQSKTTTKVAGWNGSFNYKTAVPYEINWPELFMSRLGVQL